MLEIALPIVIALLGSGGVWAALRFNREDAGAVVTQQTQVLEGMRSLNDELVEALNRCRAERIELDRTKREKERELMLKDAEIRVLEVELRRARRRDAGS